MAVEVDRLPVLAGEFRSHQPCPVIQSLADDVGAQPVSGGLQCAGIIDGQKRIIILAEADLLTDKLALDEVMAVEVVADLERQEGTDAHGQGTEHRVSDIEVRVRVPATLPADDAVVGVSSRVPRNAGAEGGSHFHTLEDEIDTEPVLLLDSPEVPAPVILLPHPVLSPFHRDAPLGGERIDPAVVFIGPFSQHVLCDRSLLVQIAEEMNNVLRPCQQRNVAQNGNAVETVVYKSQHAAKQR